MKRILSAALAALLLLGAAPLAVQATDAPAVCTGTFTVDGKVSAGEYGAPIVSLAGEGKSYWSDFYVKQNGAAASAMNEALMPESMRVYAGYDDTCLYLAVEVETNAYYNTADAAWNHFAHLRLLFDPADTQNRWDVVTLRPDGDGDFNTPGVLMQHFGTEVDAAQTNGVLTYEMAYKWEKILSTFKTDGAPTAGDTVSLQVLFAPARDKSTVYSCYLNPAGATSDEQESGTGNVYPAANWLTLTLSDKVIQSTPADTEKPADTDAPTPAPAETIRIYSAKFNVDGKVEPGEYGPPIASLRGDGKSYWSDFYIKQNGAAASAMNEALLPNGMTVYAGWDENRLYIAVEVDTDAYHNTIDAPWNHFAHLRLFFDPADTKNRWDVVSLRPDGDGKFTYPAAVMQHFETRLAAARSDSGIITYEMAYKWEKILSSVKTQGTPIEGDELQLQVLFAPAIDKSTVYQCYLNPVGSSADEQTKGANNVYPVTNWFTLELSDAEMPAYTPPVIEEPAKSEETTAPEDTTAAPEESTTPEETTEPAADTSPSETTKPPVSDTPAPAETDTPAQSIADTTDAPAPAEENSPIVGVILAVAAAVGAAGTAVGIVIAKKKK